MSLEDNLYLFSGEILNIRLGEAALETLRLRQPSSHYYTSWLCSEKGCDSLRRGRNLKDKHMPDKNVFQWRYRMGMYHKLVLLDPRTMWIFRMKTRNSPAPPLSTNLPQRDAYDYCTAARSKGIELNGLRLRLGPAPT